MNEITKIQFENGYALKKGEYYNLYCDDDLRLVDGDFNLSSAIDWMESWRGWNQKYVDRTVNLNEDCLEHELDIFNLIADLVDECKMSKATLDGVTVFRSRLFVAVIVGNEKCILYHDEVKYYATGTNLHETLLNK